MPQRSGVNLSFFDSEESIVASNVIARHYDTHRCPRMFKQLIPTRIMEAARYVRHGRLRWDDPPDDFKPAAMISENEKDFYRRCANAHRASNGAIVDLGCWLGATTIALARGQVESGIDTSPIFAFDRFVWEPRMDAHTNRVKCRYLPGESFLPEARRGVEPFPNVRLIAADLTNYTWQEGPIKILLVDAMKSWQLGTAIARQFFPSLVQGGTLIHQDFKHFYCPWIHLLQYRLRDCFALLENVRDSGTVGFTATRTVTVDLASYAADFESFTLEEVESAFQYSFDIVGDDGRDAVAAAHVMYYSHRDDLERAGSLLARYIPSGSPNQDLQLARQSVEQRRARQLTSTESTAGE